MKKRIIIPVVIVLILIIGFIYFSFFNRKIVSTIYLDINPSIVINLDKDEKAVNVNALNDDAKNILVNNYNNKSLEEILELLITKIIEKGYIHDNYLDVMLWTSGKITSEDISKKIEFIFGKNDIHTKIIVIDNVTTEDKEFAKKNSISPAKASYIRNIVNDEEIINDLVNKPISELTKTKEKLMYCDDGYFLEEDHCFKEIGIEMATAGLVCPEGYTEYKGKCYYETNFYEGTNYVCPEEFTLQDDKCIKTSSYKAEGICENGYYDSKKDKCIETVYVADAYEFCRDSGRTLYEHKCLATKPTINGKCLGKDMLYKGKCVNTKNDYYMAEWKCPNGKVISNADGSLLYEDHKCYEEKSVDPVSYECNDDFVLDGKMCVNTQIVKLEKEKLCNKGYTLIEDRACIDFNNSTNFIDGLTCNKENTRLKGNKCIIYEIIDANEISN